MKKILALIHLTCVALATFAKRLRLNHYESFMSDDCVVSNYNPTRYFFDTRGGSQWGPGFEYLLMTHYCFELQYLHQTRKVPNSYKLGTNSLFRSETPVLDLNILVLGSIYIKQGKNNLTTLVG